MASPQPGWYTDPGGAPGMFRYWDGAQWTQYLSPTQVAPPPFIPGTHNRSPYGASGSAAYHPDVAYLNGGNQPTKKNPFGWILGALALLLVVVIVIWLANGGSIGPNGGDDKPRPVPSQDLCPPAATDKPPAKAKNDNRVHGGKISFPQLGAPWSQPNTDHRVPFGRDVQEQNVMVERNPKPTSVDDWSAWVASLLVAELVAGDGFYGPQTGTEIVAKCVVGKFYGDNKVDRKDVLSKEITVDGVKAWMLEMHLGFDIKNLKAKGETAIIIVASNDPSSASLFYASIPDNAPEHLVTAREMIGKLTIDK